MRPKLICCIGESGSGKGYFIQNNLLKYGFYKLISATTREKRIHELNGRDYYFVDEDYFKDANLFTYLDVNKDIRKEGDKAWLYGVPSFEVLDNLGKNFVYDVIQPKYARQLINNFIKNNLDYEFKTIFFIPPDNKNIINSRANMKDDLQVRTKNTCCLFDCMEADIFPDFFVKSSFDKTIIDPRLIEYLESLNK